MSGGERDGPAPDGRIPLDQVQLDQLPLDQIPVGEGRTVVADGQQVAVFRLRDGSVRALGARCPHRGGPLADGLVDDTVVVCPLHGRAFDLVTGAESGGGAAATPWRVLVDDQGVVQVVRSTAEVTEALYSSQESRGRRS